jgi:signal transduction histidine kinase
MLHRSARMTADPSVAMFSRTRRRMTAWYAGILGATLLVMGIVLYIGEQQSLIGPVDSDLRQRAHNIEATWQLDPALTCQRADPGVLWACYDTSASLASATPLVNRYPQFQDRALIRTALKSGNATETVDNNSIRLYAERFTITTGVGQSSGVVELGTYVADRTKALDTLLYLLIVCGSLGLLFATLSGIFLANRSLRPVREAYVRQQDFVANASHELRTPLTMVRADAEVLLRDRQHLTDDQASILEDVVLEASHMASLATSMLELARLDAGKLRLDKEVVDLSTIAHDMARRASPLAEERGVSVYVDAPSTVLVFGDPLLLEHVALILVDNAIKYNNRGGEVILRASVRESRAILEVIDTGIGIASEHIPHLGERFYRVDKARSREAGGAGLGLSIVRSVIATHGGSLQLVSTPGAGTTATVELSALEHSPSSQITA